MLQLYGDRGQQLGEKYCCGLLTKKDGNERVKDEEEIKEEERLQEEAEDDSRPDKYTITKN